MDQEYFGEKHRRYSINRPQYTLGLALLESILTKGKILDVGSGLGEFSDLLVSRGYNTFGIEGVDEFVANQKQRDLNVQKINLENERFPYQDNSFDIVVSLDVIEHLWNTDHYLGEIKRCISPDGNIIISTVNYNYWQYRLLHCRGKMEEYTYDSRHKKFYTLNSLSRRLSIYFDIKDTAYYFRGKAVDNILYPNLRIQQFAFLCKPKEI